MTTSEFASFVLAMLVALVLFFGGQRALVELTDNEDFALPVQAVFEQPEAPEGGTAIPTPPITPPEDATTPEDITTTPPESEAPEDEPKTPEP